ncbi:MAG: branched-chain amino acid ABC transporter permease [Clostridia bacterium]
MQKNKLILGAALLIVLVVFPQFISSEYIVRVLTMVGIYMALAMSLNMLTGYLGLMSMGHAGFVGVGAFTGAILITRFTGWQLLTAATVGALVAGILGLIIGLPALRLSNSHLAIVTLGFGEIMRIVFLNWTSVTGGALGIKDIPKPVVFGLELTLANKGYLYFIMVVVILYAFINWSIMHSKIGRAFSAIKHDQLAATMMGIRTTNYKILAFIISAMMCGFVGTFYAQMQRYIDSNAFTSDMSIMIVSILVTGGLGTIRGPILGALLLVTMPEMFRFLESYRFIVYGLLLVVMMRFRPSGLLGWKSTLPYPLPKLTRELLKKNNANGPGAKSN